MQRKPSRVTTRLTLFAVSKDEWKTKEDTGKSMKNALVCQKAPWAEAIMNNETIESAIVELC